MQHPTSGLRSNFNLDTCTFCVDISQDANPWGDDTPQVCLSCLHKFPLAESRQVEEKSFVTIAEDALIICKVLTMTTVRHRHLQRPRPAAR